MVNGSELVGMPGGGGVIVGWVHLEDGRTGHG